MAKKEGPEFSEKFGKSGGGDFGKGKDGAGKKLGGKHGRKGGKRHK